MFACTTAIIDKNIADKFGKLTEIDVSLKCFTADFLLFSGTISDFPFG